MNPESPKLPPAAVSAQPPTLNTSCDGTAALEFNPYSPPTARLGSAVAEAEQPWLYVVAPYKLLLLMVLTVGLYSVYWFYRNWKLLNVHHKAYWPVPRAIFSIFFTHALFTEIDGLLRKRGIVHAWSPGGMATLYVVSAIASRVLDRVANMPGVNGLVSVAAFLTLVPIIASLYSAQRAINAAEGDPQGLRNARITWANIAWMVPGSLLLALILLGLLAITLDPSLAA